MQYFMCVKCIFLTLCQRNMRAICPLLYFHKYCNTTCATNTYSCPFFKENVCSVAPLLPLDFMLVHPGS
ncbi:hypothetical protein XENTR_v10020768 [Xenopus tropicalis]|nr:hypothetical protein XENTR_v10020768 [Xenopus tropicalis]